MIPHDKKGQLKRNAEIAAIKANATESIAEKEYNFDLQADEVAASRGLKVVLPLPNQLQIDIDSEEQYEEFNRRLYEFGFRYHMSGEDIVIEELVSSKGLPHRHIYITFKNREFNDWQRIALQAALNDDPIRSYLNARRAWCGIVNPSRLFEKP